MTMNWKTHKFTWSSSSFHPGRIFLKNPARMGLFYESYKNFYKNIAAILLPANLRNTYNKQKLRHCRYDDNADILPSLVYDVPA